jgi:hypothetical protein
VLSLILATLRRQDLHKIISFNTKMSNFFESALNDLDSLEEEILGPDYAYYKFIKNPSELGMGADGGKIATNIGGILSYVDLLSTGNSKASKAGILGDKYFMKTGATCNDIDTGEDATRSLYINNVPDNIPFISSITGTDLKGLVPGVITDMGNLNPLGIFQAFMLGSKPDCKSITMPVRDSNNIESTESAFVATADIQNMNACWFSSGKNPITGESCKESFAPYRRRDKMPDDLLIQLYYGSLGLLGLYLLMRIVTNK